jgi:hypothetical protein
MAMYAKYDGVDGSLKAPAGADDFEFRADGARPAEFRPGDWNGDGVVDAADYTVWRQTTGVTSSDSSIVDAWPSVGCEFAPGTGADAQGIIAILIGL